MVEIVGSEHGDNVLVQAPCHMIFPWTPGMTVTRCEADVCIVPLDVHHVVKRPVLRECLADAPFHFKLLKPLEKFENHGQQDAEDKDYQPDRKGSVGSACIEGDQ